MRQITEEQVEAFRARLRATDHAPGTVANYCRHLACFAQWLGEREAAPGAAAAWRSHLLERGYTPGTINTMLAYSFLPWGNASIRQSPEESYSPGPPRISRKAKHKRQNRF